MLKVLLAGVVLGFFISLCVYAVFEACMYRLDTTKSQSFTVPEQSQGLDGSGGHVEPGMGTGGAGGYTMRPWNGDKEGSDFCVSYNISHSTGGASCGLTYDQAQHMAKGFISRGYYRVSIYRDQMEVPIK